MVSSVIKKTTTISSNSVHFSLELEIGNRTSLVNEIVPRPDRCQSSFTQSFCETNIIPLEAPISIFVKDEEEFLYRPKL